MNSILKFGLNLKNIRAEYESGNVVSLYECKNVKEVSSENKVSISFEIPYYKGEAVLSKLEENMYSVSAKLIPIGTPEDRVHKITTFNLSSEFDDTTRMYVYSTYKGRIAGVQRIADLPEICKCSNYNYFFSTQNPDNAFTLVSKIKAKFKSDIEINKTETSFSIDASTTIPYTFDGEIVCQEWIICVNMPADVALIKCADSFSNGRKFENPIGWSTWDYYFTSATEDDVKENVDFIAADEVLSKKVRYIALDDGWQQREGDWLSGCRYPSGLKSLVDYIKEKGYEAGIWVAPTRLHFLCGTVMRRYDFLVCDEYGDPIKDEDMYVLDPTHPDGEKFIRETFSYLADCGFTFYKLDFVSNIVRCASRFYDKTAGHYDVLKKLFDIVRETVPKGSHIMGCSLPYGADPDICDSKRTGLDIHNVWGHVKVCTAAAVPQFAANGKLYRNDLDYLVVRGKDTTNDKMTNVINDKLGYRKANPSNKFVWRGGEDFNFDEAKTWCTTLLMAGSSVFMGDCLPKLNEKGIDLIRKTALEADFIPATPIFNGEIIPSVWYKKELSKLYLINYTDENQQYHVNLKDIGLKSGTYTDVFSGNEYAIDGEFTVCLDAHSSLALNLK